LEGIHTNFFPVKKLFTLFLLAGLSAFGQMVYKSSEVDQAADPSG
jgi:hypothetical protein